MSNNVVLSAILCCILLSTAASAILTTVPQWYTYDQDKQTVDAGATVKLSACWNMVKGIRAATLKISTDGTNYAPVNYTPDWSTSFFGPAMIQCNLTTFSFNTAGYSGKVYWGIEGILIDIPVNSSNFTANPPGSAKSIDVSGGTGPYWSSQMQEKERLVGKANNTLSAKFSDASGVVNATLWTNETGEWKEWTYSKTVDFGQINKTSAEDAYYKLSPVNASESLSKYNLAQKFSLTKNVLTAVSLKLSNPLNSTSGNVTVSIYRDNSSGYPQSVTGNMPRATVSVQASKVNNSQFNYFDLYPDIKVNKSESYYIVISNDVVGLTAVTGTPGSGEYKSNDEGKTWYSMKASVHFIAYAYEEIVNYPKEATASFTWNGTGGVIGWKISAYNKMGYRNETSVMAFTAVTECPVCPNCTEWGECVATTGREGTQERVCYKCSADTNYLCKPSSETRDCTVPFNKADADAAIADAVAAINASKTAKLNVTDAEFILAQAYAERANSKWDAAITKANEAKIAAATAQPLPVETDWMPILIAAVLVAALASLGALVYTKKIDLSKIMANIKSAQKPKEKKEEKGPKCSICGKKTTDGYICKECGKPVCYDDARTYEGEVYDVKCLKKKGVI